MGQKARRWATAAADLAVVLAAFVIGTLQRIRDRLTTSNDVQAHSDIKAALGERAKP